MKKVIPLVLAILISTSFTACQKNNTSTQSSATDLTESKNASIAVSRVESKNPSAQNSAASRLESNIDNTNKRYKKDYGDADYSHIKVEDANGNDISDVLIDLWYAANEINNEGDYFVMFEMKESQIFLDNIAYYYQILNYDEVVKGVFTKNGINQLEKRNNFIRKKNGKVYRLAPWKTGYSYASALRDIKAKESSDTKIIASVEYKKAPYVAGTDVPQYNFIDFVIVKENGIWMVDSYIYPEHRPRD